MVARARREELQDANPRRPRTARLQARRLRRLSAVHHAAAPECSVQDALLPRRRPLGAETTELPALVQDRERLGRPIHGRKTAMSISRASTNRKPKKPGPLDEAALYEYAIRTLGRRMRTVTELKRLMQTRVEPGEAGEAKVSAVVLRLKEQRYLDDTAYAA